KTPEERAEEALRDPLPRMRHLLVSHDLASEDELGDLAAGVEREVSTAAEQALAAPKPAPESATRHVVSPTGSPTDRTFERDPEPSGPPETMVTAINSALRDEMARDPRIVVFGQDVADTSRPDVLGKVAGKGGVFKVTHGLQAAFGGDRVFNAPLAEANIIGR